MDGTLIHILCGDVFLLSSDSVNESRLDKLCDQVSDAMLVLPRQSIFAWLLNRCQFLVSLALVPLVISSFFFVNCAFFHLHLFLSHS